MNDQVRALHVYDGELIATGSFTAAGGEPASRIARWDGNTWRGLGDGLSNWGNYLTSYEGNLIVGGWFASAGGVQVNKIARWDGVVWSPIGDGVSGESVRTMTVHNDELIVGGFFTSAGGVPANNIAKWNSSNWEALGNGVNDGVLSLLVHNGDLLVGGRFTEVDGEMANHIAIWRQQVLGACCINGTAIQTFQSDCEAAGGTYFGDGVPSSGVTCDSPCSGDLNGDGVVDVSDLLTLLADWGFCAEQN